MSFQKAVNPYQAPAVAGDFAAHNPNASMLAGEGALVSGTDGVTVGVFAWADAEGKVSNKKTAGARIGLSTANSRPASPPIWRNTATKSCPAKSLRWLWQATFGRTSPPVPKSAKTCLPKTLTAH